MKLFVCLLTAILFFSCGNKQEEKAVASNDSSSVYYPINTYFRQQIKDVDTTPYFLYRLTIIDGLKDSSIINRATFDVETKPFILPQLEDKVFRTDFTESVFDDAGTGSITLTYTPKDKNNLVQNASVLLDKESQQVKWIFINTLSSNGDSTVLQRIGWKGGQSCYLNKDISYPNKKENLRQVSFVWNEKKE